MKYLFILLLLTGCSSPLDTLNNNAKELNRETGTIQKKYNELNCLLGANKVINTYSVKGTPDQIETVINFCHSLGI